MEQSIRQFLRLTFDDASYLLPSTASIAIEKREGLATQAGSALIAAWRESSAGRWPAYSFGSDLRPAPRANWTRAVFLNAAPSPVGMVTDEIQLIAAELLVITPFQPLGPKPTAAGHLFNAAHVENDMVMLVFDPNALANYLVSLGGTA